MDAKLQVILEGILVTEEHGVKFSVCLLLLVLVFSFFFFFP